MIYTTEDGSQIDLSTGQLVGQGKSQVVTPQEATEQKLENYSGGIIRTALDGLKQLSFGFNTALFSLPDTVIKEVGSALGVSKEEIPTFTSFFNRGATAPKNAVERYANAIGQGAGIAAPFTGVLGAVARTKALTAPITAGAPIAKTLAKETLDFIRANPRAAVALDLGFGAAYTGIEQAVEEYTEPGMPRDILKATLPLGATVAVPMAANKIMGLAQKLWSISPTVNIIRGIRGADTSIPSDDVRQAVADTIPKIPFLRGPLGWLGNWYGSRAQKGISNNIMTALERGGLNTQEQIQLTKQIQQFAAENGFDDKFAFNLAEATMNRSLRSAYDEAVANSSGAIRTQINERNKLRDQAFEDLAKKLTPEAQLSLQEALVINSAERNRTIDDVLKKVSGLEESERNRLVDLFDTETTLADVGYYLRSGIIAQRNATLGSRLQEKVDEMLRRPFGVRQATRVEGLPIEGIPAIPFQNFAIGFNNKYNLGIDNRWFGGEVPTSAKEIAQVMSKVKAKQEEFKEKALNEVVHGYLLKTSGYYKNISPEEQTAQRTFKINALERGLHDKAEDLALLDEVKKLVGKYSEVDITLPEAMDLLLSAQRFKTHMFLKAQDDLSFGIPRTSTDQTRRFGEEVLRDVEDFIFKADRYGKGFSEVPGINDLETLYRNVSTNAYDKLFPLMATKKRATGEFVTGDEQLVREALKSRENLRALNAIFGDNPTYARQLQKAMLIRAHESGVIGKDGLLNEQAFNRFLVKNKSIIDDLPESVQATLRDEIKLGQQFADDLAAVKAEKDALADLEMDRLIKEVIKPDADPATFIQNALARPQDMRKLVDVLGKDPEQLKALRRGVWESVVGKMLDPADPILLSDFKRRYGKSLAILYPDPKDQRNLDMLSVLQERIIAVARPPDELSPFKTLDQRLREVTGAGVGTIESTARAAAIRIISPIHAGVSLGTRLLSRQQQGVAERILLNALIDDAYAAKLINASASIETKKGFNQASKLTMDVGGYLPSLLRNAPTVAAIEGFQAQPQEALPYSLQPETPPRPPAMPTTGAAPAPRTTAPARREPVPAGQAFEQIMQGGRPQQKGPTPAAPAAAKPAAPGTPRRPVPQMPSPDGAQGGPSQPGPGQEMYRLLFPNDLVSPMMQRPQ
jgi:hypothetical protein